MFTGIVREVGHVLTRGARDRAGDDGPGDTRFRISCARRAENIEIGASIACDGVCLTVIARGTDSAGENWFDVETSAETLSRTTLGGWREGAPVNLEPSLRVGDELGGHIVTGHVDGVGRVVSATPEGGSVRIAVAAPKPLARYIAEKGSITLAGVSLTVNEVEDGPEGARFGINLIPHTREATTLGALAPGAEVNLEIDVLARYVARLAAAAG